MNIIISEVTDEEFDLIRPHFRVKTSALAMPIHFSSAKRSRATQISFTDASVRKR